MLPADGPVFQVTQPYPGSILWRDLPLPGSPIRLWKEVVNLLAPPLTQPPSTSQCPFPFPQGSWREPPGPLRTLAGIWPVRGGSSDPSGPGDGTWPARRACEE